MAVSDDTIHLLYLMLSLIAPATGDGAFKLCLVMAPINSINKLVDSTCELCLAMHHLPMVDYVAIINVAAINVWLISMLTIHI